MGRHHKWNGILRSGVTAEGEPAGGIYEIAQCRNCGARYKKMQQWQQVEKFAADHT